MLNRKSRGSATPFASEWIVVTGRIKGTNARDFNNKISANSGLNPKALWTDEMIFLNVAGRSAADIPGPVASANRPRRSLHCF
jgi:hypothetical protein